MAAKGLGDTGEIVMVTGFTGNPTTINRRKGFTDELAKIAPGIKIVGEQPGNWQPGESQKAMAGLLTQYPNIKGVFAQDDAMASGVVAALEQAGRNPSELAIVSLVCYPVGRELIKSGKIFSTVVQSPMEDATASITTMADYLDGKPVEAEFYLNAIPVNRDNVDEVCPEWPTE